MNSPETAPLDSPPPPARPRRLVWVALAALALVALAPGALWGARVWLERWATTPWGEGGTVELRIERGTPLRAIAGRLEAEGLVSDQRLLLVWLRLNEAQGGLQAGDYRIPRPISPAALVERLGRGSFARTLTIPEGWTVIQIGERLVREGWLDDAGRWHELVSRPLPAELLGQPIPNAEGFCFPETYTIEEGVSAEQILGLLLGEFQRRWQALHRDPPDPRAERLSPLELVTLASMVQREARVEDEMPLIAAVYYNRLRRGMRLQCDATVYYALGRSWLEPLRRSDLDTDHPYNTYRRAGLPPGPIANPGAAALAAALRPAEHDYLYYVYHGDGRHSFSRTLAEHNRAVRQARRARE